MKGITFNGQHSFADWGLILTHYAANSPTIKKQTVEIAGRDGVLDMTEYFGGVKYGNRQLDFAFVLPNVSAADYSAKLSLLQDKLHGVQVRVEPDVEPLYYYEGRAEVSGNLDRTTAEFHVVVDASPYKLKREETAVSVSLDGTTQNIYDVTKLVSKGQGIQIGADDFITCNYENNSSDAIQYDNFFTQKIADVMPNYPYCVIVEVAECSGVSGDASIIIASSTPYERDCFLRTDNIELANEINDTNQRFIIRSRDASELDTAIFFMRSFILMNPKAKGRVRFRVSVMLEEPQTPDFVYTSHDGTMKGVALYNSRKPVVPTITASSSFTIIYEGKTFSINAGTLKIPEIVLKEGRNDISFIGKGDIRFSYREGRL